MIIDLILDRKDGQEFNPVDFGLEIADYCEVFPEIANPILSAIERKSEELLKFELCRYIIENGYNLELCNYINSVSWLPNWWDME